MRQYVYLIVFFSFFDLFTQLPIMSPLAESLGATPFLIGLTVGMYSFSNMIGNVISGFLTDKKGAFAILISGLLLTGISILLYHLAVDSWSLLFVRFLHGLLGGLIVPAAFTYLANASATEKKGQNSAITGAFVGIAAVIGPAFSGIIASRTSELTVLTVTAVSLLLLGIFSTFLLSRNKETKSLEKQEEVLLLQDFKINSNMIKAFLGAFLLMFSQGVLAYMLPLKILNLGYDTQTSGFLLSTFGITAITIFLSPTNKIFDSVKSIFTLAFGLAVMGGSLIFISQITTLQLLYVFMVFYGVGFAFLFPSINSLLIASVNTANRGKAYGHFYAAFSLGVVVGSGLTGLFEFTAGEGFLFTGGLLFLSAFGSLINKRSTV